MEFAYRTYVDQAMTATRTRLLAEISGRVVMVKASFQQQFNELKSSIGATLQEVKAQVAEVQKSQDNMWGAISTMGEDLRELTNRGDSSASEDEGQEDAPEDSGIPPNVIDPLTTRASAPAALAVSFGAFDAASVRDSVSSAVPRPPAPRQESWKPEEDLFAGKATAGEKGKFLDPMVGASPPHMDFTASVSGVDVSLVGQPANTTATFVGGSTPLATAGGHVKIEAPPRYSGRRQPSVRVWLTQMEQYMRLMRYSPSDWLDIVAMRAEGAASSWVNAVLQDVAAGHKAAFLTWRQFMQAMIH